MQYMCTSELLCGSLRDVPPTPQPTPTIAPPPLHERLLTNLCRLLQDISGTGGSGAAAASMSMSMSTSVTPRASLQQSSSSQSVSAVPSTASYGSSNTNGNGASGGAGAGGPSPSLTVSSPMASGSASSLVDPVLISTFLAHSWFFLELLAKSAGLHLLSSSRIRMLRNERFPKSVTGALEAFVGLFVDWLVKKAQTESNAVQSSNESLARFIRVHSIQLVFLQYFVRTQYS